MALDLGEGSLSALFLSSMDPLSCAMAVDGCRVCRARLCMLQALDFCVPHMHNPEELEHYIQGISPEPFLTGEGQRVTGSFVSLFEAVVFFVFRIYFSISNILQAASPCNCTKFLQTAVALLWVKRPHYAATM